MRVAFYAPMKPPDHPVPSGDRAVARLLIQALRLGGHRVELASRFRTWQGRPDLTRQARLAELGERLTARLIAHYRDRSVVERPEAWLTYHLYYKAPDLIGPRVAAALGIPYLLVEASLAYKRAGGPWDIGHRAAVASVEAAALVLQINPEDAECLPPGTRQELLPAFLDAAPYRAARARRAALRAGYVERLGLDPQQPWIVALAMMREGDKLASYRILAEALGQVTTQDWQLLVIGDGPARQAVEAAFAAALGPAVARLRYLGQLPEEALAEPLAAADLFAWPAVNEAYGMALLEAQASGLPAVVGRRPGVAAILQEGETGLLAEIEEPAAFARPLARLLAEPGERTRMGAAAAARIDTRHDLPAAAARLTAALEETRL